MNVQVLHTPDTGDRVWFGMGTFEVRAPSGNGALMLPYVGEPGNFSDSQHRILFEQWVVPGLAWGDGLAWSPESKYVLLDWASRVGAQQRITVALDVERRATFAFSERLPFERFVYPRVFGANGEVVYQFNGNEEWATYAA
jgi:hypothetical protein